MLRTTEKHWLIISLITLGGITVLSLIPLNEKLSLFKENQIFQAYLERVAKSVGGFEFEVLAPIEN